MAESERDLEKLRAEQEKEDDDLLDDLEKESKTFDKVNAPDPVTKYNPRAKPE